MTDKSCIYLVIVSTVLGYMLLKQALIILHSTAHHCCQNIKCKSNTQIGAVLIGLLYAAMWLTVVTEKCMYLGFSVESLDKSIQTTKQDKLKQLEQGICLLRVLSLLRLINTL